MANASYGTGLYVNYGSAALYLDIYETPDPGNNRSWIRGVVTLAHSGSGSPFNNNTSYASLSIGGSSWGWSGGYNLPGNSSATLIDAGVWVGHDANGAGSVGVSAAFDGNGNFPIGDGSTGGTYTMQDFDRRPSVPTFNTISRSIDDFYVSLNGVSSPAGTPTYYIQRSQNGGGWGDDRATSATWFYDLPRGSSQQFRCAAYNSDGWSDWSYSGVYTVPNLPSAPSSIAATTPSALSSTISIGTAANGGSAITAYYVQASPDDGVTWQSAQLMTNQSYTYTGLTPGATYKFRAYAVNEMGSGPFVTTGSTFVPAGGKRWTGTAWQPTQTAKRWTGTQWVDLTIAKRWSGTAWVDLS